MQAPKLAESLIENFTHRNKKWIVLFPEGGLLWKRRASSQRLVLTRSLFQIFRLLVYFLR